VELAEYSLPVLSNQRAVGPRGSGAGKAGLSAQGKGSSGMINNTSLPPINGKGGMQQLQDIPE
jgi:hypothetical protein